MLVEELARARERVARVVKADGADNHQVAVDQLVWCRAYYEAVQAMQAWAHETSDSAVRAMAAAAEAEASTLLRGCGIDEAISRGELLAEIGARSLPAEDLAASDEHRLLRRAVRDFAAAEIQLIAQAVHRGDLDVPESVISGVARMGLFGVSVPEAYGGLQQGAPDTRSVLTATEELFRNVVIAQKRDEVSEEE